MWEVFETGDDSILPTGNAVVDNVEKLSNILLF